MAATGSGTRCSFFSLRKRFLRPERPRAERSSAPDGCFSQPAGV